MFGGSGTRGNDAGHYIHPRIHGGDPLGPPTLLVPAEHILPLRLLLERVPPTRRDLPLVPLPELPAIHLRRLPGLGTHLKLNPLRTGLPLKLRALLLGQPLAHLREARGVLGLRSHPRRRHCQAGSNTIGRKQGPGCPRILQRQFHLVLHPNVLVQPFAVSHVRG